MQISGITYVKRKKRWVAKFLLYLFIALAVLFIIILGLLMFTNITIPYISDWLKK